jgi:hypothetical protein
LPSRFRLLRQKKEQIPEIGIVRSIQSLARPAWTPIKLLFDFTHIFRVERTDNHFVPGATAYRWPDAGKTGCDGVPILPVRRESTTMVCNLAFCDIRTPENQKVVL